MQPMYEFKPKELPMINLPSCPKNENGEPQMNCFSNFSDINLIRKELFNLECCLIERKKGVTQELFQVFTSCCCRYYLNLVKESGNNSFIEDFDDYDKTTLYSYQKSLSILEELDVSNVTLMISLETWIERFIKFFTNIDQPYKKSNLEEIKVAYILFKNFWGKYSLLTGLNTKSMMEILFNNFMEITPRVLWLPFIDERGIFTQKVIKISYVYQGNILFQKNQSNIQS